jgi:hypothetical protein
MVTASIGVAVRKAVTDGLVTHLGELDAFNGMTAAERHVEVTFGYAFGQQFNEQVYTGKSRADTPPAGLRSGRGTKNEAGQFDLNVLVRFVGGDAYDAEARAEEIGGAIESWLAERRSNELGVDGLTSLIVDSWEADYSGIDSGIAALRTYTVRWTARIE